MSDTANRRELTMVHILLLATVSGITAGLLTVIFMGTFHLGVRVLWEMLPAQFGLPEATPIVTIAIALVGGLLVGLSRRFADTHPDKPLGVELQEGQGKLNYRHVPAMTLTGIVSLIFGGSIGPEAPLMHLVGGAAGWIAERIKATAREALQITFSAICGALGIFFGSPFGGAIFVVELSRQGGRALMALILPAMIGATLGFSVFFVITGDVIGGLITFPEYDGVKALDLFLSVPLACIGAAIGVLFLQGIKQGYAVYRPLAQRPIVRGLIGGMVLAAFGVFSPLLLFSGEAEFHSVQEQAAELGVLLLLTLAGAKILVTASCLGAGYRGGTIFPAIFAGGCVGLAFSELLPFIPAGVAVAVLATAVATVILKAPLGVVVMFTAISQDNLAPVMCVAATVSFLLALRIEGNADDPATLANEASVPPDERDPATQPSSTSAPTTSQHNQV